MLEVVILRLSVVFWLLALFFGVLVRVCNMLFSTFVVSGLTLVLSVNAQTVTRNARCGPDGLRRTCLGSQWGHCCSQYGWWYVHDHVGFLSIRLKPVTV